MGGQSHFLSDESFIIDSAATPFKGPGNEKQKIFGFSQKLIEGKINCYISCVRGRFIANIIARPFRAG
jgi:hypothetical protein